MMLTSNTTTTTLLLPSPRTQTLIDMLCTLHEPVSAEVLESQFVREVERLLPGSAAAIFRVQPDNLVTRRAAGPRWRTAEQDAPAWLGLNNQAIAQAVRTGSPLFGQFVLHARIPDESRLRELIQQPLIVAGECWGSLLVLRPAEAEDRTEDVWVAESCARHLAAALTRLASRPQLRRWD